MPFISVGRNGHLLQEAKVVGEAHRDGLPPLSSTWLRALEKRRRLSSPFDLSDFGQSERPLSTRGLRRTNTVFATRQLMAHAANEQRPDDKHDDQHDWPDSGKA